MVFGGFRRRSFLNDLHVLDVNLWRWQTVRIRGDGPAARVYHSATVIDAHRVLFFGGNNLHQCFNDIHILDTSGGDGNWKWEAMVAGGVRPRPRSGHTATLLPGGKRLLVWGGWDVVTLADDDGPARSGKPSDSDPVHGGERLLHASAYNDAWELDLQTWCWTRRKVTGSSADVGDGGVVATQGRIGHGAVAVVDVSGAVSLCAFGGQAADERFADVRMMPVT